MHTLPTHQVQLQVSTSYLKLRYWYLPLMWELLEEMGSPVGISLACQRVTFGQTWKTNFNGSEPAACYFVLTFEFRPGS